MNSEHKALRAMLSGMAPKRAAQAVRLVGLPPDVDLNKAVFLVCR